MKQQFNKERDAFQSGYKAKFGHEFTAQDIQQGLVPYTDPDFFTQYGASKPPKQITPGISKRSLQQIIGQHLEAELRPVMEAKGITNEMERLKIIAMDDVMGVLKKGASMLWDSRHALFPTLAPVIDKAVSSAKMMISNLGGPNLAKNLKQAIMTDHSAASQKLSQLGSQIQQSGMNYLTSAFNQKFADTKPQQQPFLPLQAQNQIVSIPSQILPSKVFHGIDSTAIKSIISPIYIDQQNVKRIPYGSNATSLYKRLITVNFDNDFGGTNYAKMALIYSPLGSIFTVVPLASDYTITSETAVPAVGGVALSVYTAPGTQKSFQVPFQGIPQLLSYRIVGSSVRSEYQGNFMDVQGRHTGISLRYPDENTAASQVGCQQQLLRAGAYATTGHGVTYLSSTNNLGILNTFDAAPLGVRGVALNPSNYTLEQTYVTKAIIQPITTTMPLNDYEDAQFVNNQTVISTEASGVVASVSKTDRNNILATGYSGTANAVVAHGADLMSLHMIIYDNLPIDKTIPFQITVATHFEGIIAAQSQYLNPPARPDYSKETFDKLIELVSTNPNIWTLDKQEADQVVI